MLADQRIAPQTAAVANVQVNASEADKVIFAWCGTAPTAADAVLFWIASSTGRTPVYTPAGTQATITATLQSIMLEGGFEYIMDKSVTAGVTGVDVSFKPRIF
jgi:hypothetical protein